MTNSLQERVACVRTTIRRSRWSGFSMIELMIAMAVFAIVGGAAISLFRQHASLFVTQQNQVGLNYSIRNAITQMQIDVANAGDGFYQSADTPGWPVGVTVVNQAYVSETTCWNSVTFVYSQSCFDQLFVIAADKNTPAAHVGVALNTSSTSTLELTPTGATTLAQLAADYKTGDQILFLNSAGTLMTTAILAANGAIDSTNTYVQLTFGKTNTDGSNTSANDNFAISTSADTTGLSVQYGTTDWVLKLAPISYTVNTVIDPNSPKLVRTQVATSTQAASTDIIAEQVIGFKIGVSLYDLSGSSDTDDAYTYTSSASNLTNFTKVRAIRVSLICRAPSASGSTYTNTFDHGPYKIEAASVVVNPRSLSMKDQ